MSKVLDVDRVRDDSYAQSLVNRLSVRILELNRERYQFHVKVNDHRDRVVGSAFSSDSLDPACSKTSDLGFVAF
jgi:hypothetical protein